MNVTKAAGLAAVALAGYDTLVRPRMLGWGASRGEQHMQLPGSPRPAVVTESSISVLKRPSRALGPRF